MNPRTIEWFGDLTGGIRMIDQTLLPTQVTVIECRDIETVWEAIKSLRVRGAPAIGVAAAMGMVIGARRFRTASPADFHQGVAQTANYLKTSRPTAVNLFWAIDRMVRSTEQLRDQPVDICLQRMLFEARAIRDEDEARCVAIGRHGEALIPDGAGVLTHCNAGALATADFGTALSVIIHAHHAGKRLHVWVDETRPLLQGSRLTAWELQQRGVPATLICDNMAALVMQQGKIQAAIVGADRIAANGDTANKIGTYAVAVLCQAHGIPFYVAAPSSTFDLSLQSGAAIPIEIRDGREISHGFGRQTAPDAVTVYNPAFDVTPARLIQAFVTELGILRPPFVKTIPQGLSS